METPYDESSGTGRSPIPYKPVTSSNKATTFPAKHKSDNEETPKRTHQGTFTPKQETLERIKRLHIKYGFLDTEHLFMFPKNWLEYLQY